MRNKLMKAVSWTLCGCALMLCSGVISYEITKTRLHSSQNTIREEEPLSEMMQAKTVTGDELPVTGGAEELEYYVARMNGKKLGIFVCSNNTERFSYDLEVDFYSLSERDQALLTQGVVLYNEEELAKFIEDFTS